MQSIYPIQEEGDGFAIRGLDLPYNYEAKDDEVVSSALGYVTHLMLMLSKYLQIPLRYQLVYSASRSAVRDRVAPGRDTPSPTSNIYPLYRRGVDNARFVINTPESAAMHPRHSPHRLKLGTACTACTCLAYATAASTAVR